MASEFYHKILPDYRDMNNKTGNCPPINLLIVEDDGEIGLRTWTSEESGSANGKEYYMFLNVKEAEEFKKGLQDAIDSAKEKLGGKLGHEDRAKDSVE